MLLRQKLSRVFPRKKRTCCAAASTHPRTFRCFAAASVTRGNISRRAYSRNGTRKASTAAAHRSPTNRPRRASSHNVTAPVSPRLSRSSRMAHACRVPAVTPAPCSPRAARIRAAPSSAAARAKVRYTMEACPRAAHAPASPSRVVVLPVPAAAVMRRMPARGAEGGRARASTDRCWGEYRIGGAAAAGEGRAGTGSTSYSAGGSGPSSCSSGSGSYPPSGSCALTGGGGRWGRGTSRSRPASWSEFSDAGVVDVAT
mmetsp:Transcript_5769/g.12105  ORF Transcript_5769/g.12105 Transcript_5769/m.12105 type:complete len:257 (-) Transcript_5769:544-1314(-)